MRKIVLILVLTILFTSTYGQSLNDEKASLLIEEELNKNPEKIYSDRTDVYGGKNIILKSVKIIKRGKYRKEKNYWPIRARIEGKTMVNSEVKDYFDKVVEAKVSINDFDEWVVKVAKLIDSPIYIKIPKLKKISKLPNLDASVFNKKYKILKYTDFKNDEKINKNSLSNYNATKTLFAASDSEDIIHLYIKDLKTGKIENLIAGSFVEKCAWSMDNINIFCGVPPYYQNSLTRKIIGKWLKNNIEFEDDLAKININSIGTYELVIDSYESKFDIVNIMLGNKKRYIYWQDKHTNTFWAFDTE